MTLKHIPDEVDGECGLSCLIHHLSEFVNVTNEELDLTINKRANWTKEDMIHNYKIYNLNLVFCTD